jgi:hypothetical protein
VRALAIPDNPAELATWLESELVGLDLRRLGAELAAVHRGSPAPVGTLDNWLAGYRDAVLRRGLAAMPPERLAALLRRPDWLLELQQLVLTEGGPYWDALPRSPALEARAEGTWRKLADRLDPPAVPSSLRKGWWIRTGLPALAASVVTAAAVLLIGFYLPSVLDDGARVTQRGGTGTGPTLTEFPAWGFARFAGASPEVGREEYLRQLATSAGEWTKQRPTDAAGVARRIGEFRQGCSAILLADHKPLTPEDRKWLKDRCRTWADALDRHLAAVEAGADPIAVRTEVDDTVTRISAALLGRAETPPG